MARILIIEDNDDMRHVCRVALEMSGYLVDEAPNGAVGVERFRRELPDVVVCDVFLPIKDGPATVAEILGEAPDAKIILITGAAQDQRSFTRYATQLGAVSALVKPFNAKQLVDAVASVLADRV